MRDEKIMTEIKEFLEKIRKICHEIEIPQKSKFTFTYREKAKEEIKKIIKDAIKSGNAKVEFQKSQYYHEGDGYNAGIRETVHVYLICEKTPYGTMGFSLEPLFDKKFIVKTEQITDEDIEELVEKLDIDFELEHGFPPKHPFRLKYKRLKEQEWKEYEKFKEREKAKIKQWEQENKEKLEKIRELYNNLSEEAKDKLRYLMDPYDGLFGLDPTPEQIIKFAKNPPF